MRQAKRFENGSTGVEGQTWKADGGGSEGKKGRDGGGVGGRREVVVGRWHSLEHRVRKHWCKKHVESDWPAESVDRGEASRWN